MADNEGVEREAAALQAYARIQSVQEAERRSFEPARLIERLVLQILGGWSNVIAESNFARYNAAGSDAEWAQESKLVMAVRELAENFRVRWPHDDFAAAADHAGNVRHQLAHMMFIKEIAGDSPTRFCVSCGSVSRGAATVGQGSPSRVEVARRAVVTADHPSSGTRGG